MSYLKLIKDYQTVDLSNHIPFYVGQEHVGWVQILFAKTLGKFDNVFCVDKKSIKLVDALDDFDKRSIAVKRVLKILADRGVLKHNPYGPHNPLFPIIDIYPVGPDPFNNPLMGIERFYTNFFGTKGYNASLIAYNNRGVWVAKRSDKVISPNKLDHTASGSCVVGQGLLPTLINEAYDESGLEEQIVRQAKPLWVFNALKINQKNNVHNECYNLYELKLPDDHQITITDNPEVSWFRLFSIDELKNEILNKDHMLSLSKALFTYFLLHHGHIREGHTEYSALVEAFNYDPAEAAAKEYFSTNS